MSSPLPDYIDPWRAVDAGAEFDGAWPLSGLSRLRESLRETEGEVGYRLAFARDLEGRATLRGEIEARLVLTCQRCLGALEWDVAAPLGLALVSGLDEARLLSEDLDPLLVSEEPIRLLDLIEDELLLALPQIAMHEPGDCAPPSQEAVEEGEELEDARGVHPFAILGELGRGGKS
ncbi:MAG: YceD family protein [Chromatiaceae bacterium]